MSVYYNEFDPQAAAWLKQLIVMGELPKGDVDERDIRKVKAGDLEGYTQVHLFAGIGGWPLALMRAGWSATRPVWTGSCPCPPFSSAGKNFRCPECDTGSPIPNAIRTGAFNCIRCGHEWQADERHLWPEVFRLYRHNNNVTFFGEQVASKDGRTWLDIVRASLEMLGNPVGVLDACSAGIGSPNIRQRLWFVAQGLANSGGVRRDGGSIRAECEGSTGEQEQRGASGRLANANSNGKKLQRRNAQEAPSISKEKCQSKHDTSLSKRGSADDLGSRNSEGYGVPNNRSRPGPVNGFWRNADWLFCKDAKWRCVEPGTFPLVNGASTGMGLGGDNCSPESTKEARTMRLKGYGNAINVELATEFINAFMEEAI